MDRSLLEKIWKTRRCASCKKISITHSFTDLVTTWNQEMLAHLKRKVSNKTLQNLFSVTSKTLYWGAIQISLKCGLHYVFLCVCVFFITKEKNGFWHFPVKVSGWPNFPLGVYQWGQLKTPCITESFDLVRSCLPKYLLRHCLLDGCASMPRIHESSSSPN